MATAALEPTVALAHHWLTTMRGGEKLLAGLAELFPDAPLYTLLARPERLEACLRQRRIETSWLQRLAWIPDVHRKALPLLAAAAHSLDATAHDVVICSDAATIKAIRTRPDALKICYCHSPVRYAWDLYDAYYARAGLFGRVGLRLFAGRVRRADRVAAETVTAFVANSRHVAERIARCYDRPSVVIPPPVDTDFPPASAPPEDFYLVVGEHVAYKRNDLAIDACVRLGRPLVVIGTGPLLKEMQRRARSPVRVLGWQDEAVVRDHLRRCRALLFCGQEDFGLVPVEAQAAGRPVIAFRAGGALETVVENRSGVFFDRQDVTSVTEAIERFESAESLWPASQIQRHARQFSTSRFRWRFERFYRWCLDQYRAGGADQVRQAMATIAPDAFFRPTEEPEIEDEAQPSEPRRNEPRPPALYVAQRSQGSGSGQRGTETSTPRGS
ncbi:MAG: glycosyltransferase [Sedimentisphaerales bacterium]|nr:glycosyltransferase [Sedimentisphaerales bacterium]